MIVRSQRGIEALAYPSQRGQSVTTVLSGRHLPIRKLYRAPSHNSLISLLPRSTMMIDALFITGLLNYVSITYVDTYVVVNFSDSFSCVSDVKACETHICML